MWKDILKNTVLKPLLTRLGTIGATWLIVGGDWACTHFSACGLVTESGAAEVMRYVVAVMLLCCDLLLQRISDQSK